MTIIYNAHHDGDQYRITKFVDGNPESSYLCTFRECECPAGHRDTCRHRQMLPEMIDRGLVNSHLFLNWDHPARPTCQFDGMIDPVPAVFAKDYPVVPEGQHVEEDTPALPDSIQMFNLAETSPADLFNAIAEAVGEPTLPAAKPFRRI